MRQFIDKLATNILRYLPSFLILTVPLFFLPLTPDFFQINKQFLIYIVASLALIFFCLRLITRGSIQITLSPATLPLSGFALIVLLSTFILHPNPRFALINFTAVAISLFIIFLAVTSTQKNALAVKSILIALVSTTVILSIFAILNQFGLISQLSGPEWLKTKFFNPAGSPYHYLTLAIPVLISTIGFGIVTRNWLIKPLALAAAIIIAAGSAFSFKLLLPTSDSQGMILLPYSTGWSVAVDTFKTPKTALLGTGPDTFTYVFTKLKPASLNLNNDLWSIRFPNSSSEFLTLLTTIGVIGLLLFSLAYIKTIKSLLYHKFTSDPETVFILAGLTTWVLSFFLLPSNITAQTLGIILLIAASIKLKLTSSHSIKDVQLNLSTQQISAYTDVPGTHKPNLPLLPWLLMLTSIVLLSVFWNIASKVYSANLTIFDASQNVKDNQVKSYNKQIEASQIDPLDPYLKMNLSQTYLAITKSLLTPPEGQTLTDENKKKALEFANQAINEAKLAANLAPYDVTVWENFASIARFLAGYEIEGSNDWTLATYAQAISLDPTNPILRVQLGTFYFQINDIAQAIKVLEQAIELKPNWDVAYYNLSLVYKSSKDYAKALAYMQEAQKYALPGSKNTEQIQKDITELEKLAPKPTATPTPTPAAN